MTGRCRHRCARFIGKLSMPEKFLRGIRLKADFYGIRRHRSYGIDELPTFCETPIGFGSARGNAAPELRRKLSS